MKNKCTPDIRFMGFTEDWEQRKFFDNIKSTIDFRGRTPRKLGLEWSDSGYLALSALNVKNGYIDPSADAHYGDEELYQKWMGGRELKQGQVLFTTEAPMGNVAQVPDNKGYILSQRTIAFDVYENQMTNDFLRVLLNSPKVFNELFSLSSGGTAKGVSQKSLSQLKVEVPKSLEEQTKIGNFFKQLDETIPLLQQELTTLKQTKQGFLQKMFPKEGETVPEVRFPGFTEDWEQRKLGDILVEKISNGMMNRPGKNQLGVKNINVVNLYSPSYIHEDELEYIDATEKEVYKYNVEVGDIFLTRSSLKVEGIAQANILLSFGTYVFDDHIMRMKLNKDYSNFFVKEMLNHNYVKKQFMSKSKTGTMTTIGQEDISSSHGIFPSFREQEKIGSILFQFDNLITLHQRKLDALKETKKAFLQKMFV